MIRIFAAAAALAALPGLAAAYPNGEAGLIPGGAPYAFSGAVNAVSGDPQTARDKRAAECARSPVRAGAESLAGEPLGACVEPASDDAALGGGPALSGS